MKNLLACLVLAVAACGGGNKPAPTTTANTQPTTASKLTITKLDFYQNEQLGLKLAADGSISIKANADAWETVAKLAADGKITTADGKLVATFQDDGTVKVLDGSTDPGIKIDGTTLTAAGKTISIDAKGVFTGGNPEVGTLRVDGLTDDGSKRTALLLMGMMSVGGKVKAKAE